MNSNSTFCASEVLTVSQFAERLKVSRTTIFGWLKNGELRENVHYLRLGRILRFIWPFILEAQPTPESSANVSLQPSALEALPYRKGKCRKKRGTQPVINLDY